MPELVEQMYCSQQIVVPPKFPYILKKFCKAAIKTQPYDLLRWSFEYFKALAHHQPPPVKLRLEYPVFATEGGLTRGCLKVLAHQMVGMTHVPLSKVKAAWGGFCLDATELKRILCLCEAYMRADQVPFLHFIAVAGGLLTKSLTHTMILLCETLTAEPDGGSAAIPVKDFLLMYKFLARLDASKDICYYDGYREGEVPVVEAAYEEDHEEIVIPDEREPSFDEFWGDPSESPLHLRKLIILDDNVARNTKISMKLNAPPLGEIERSPSIERLRKIERENYLMERKAKVISRNEGVDRQLKEMSSAKLNSLDVTKEEQKDKEEQKALVREEKGAEPRVDRMDNEVCEILVFDEDGVEIPYEFYGEPKPFEFDFFGEDVEQPDELKITEEEIKNEEAVAAAEEEAEKMEDLVTKARKERREDLQRTFNEIAVLVDKFKTAHYDLGMVAGRQMSTTSGEFIVQHIEREIMSYIDEQIAILPDPDLKKKKAKPEEVAMIKELLENFLDENMEVICPEVEEVEEEEVPIPDVVTVYAVPGIGPPVDADIVKDFEEYVLEAVKVQADLFMPRNIRHFLCPPLEKYVEYDYGHHDASKKKEEAPTAGAITD